MVATAAGWAGAEAALPFARVDDLFASEQWSLFNFGQDIGGKPGGVVDVDVRAPEAWSITRVTSRRGRGPRHRRRVRSSDLGDRFWTNPGETGNDREANEVDDDNNGFVDDWHGWDFADDDNDPTDERAKSVPDQVADLFHGTAATSVIAANANDGIGMAGVAPKSRIMPLRVIGNGIQDDDLAGAIAYAHANGARIVSLSLATLRARLRLPPGRAGHARRPRCAVRCRRRRYRRQRQHRQLAAVGPGGVLAGLLHRRPDLVVTLDANVRQADPAERHALAELRDGSVPDAVA